MIVNVKLLIVEICASTESLKKKVEKLPNPHYPEITTVGIWVESWLSRA